MTPLMRPMSIGDLFDAIFRLYRANFLMFIGIAALIQIPLILLQLGLEMALGRQYANDLFEMLNGLAALGGGFTQLSDLIGGDFVTYLAISFFLGLIQIAVVQQVLNGALANAISRRYLDQPVSVVEAYQFGRNRLVALISVGLLVALLTIVVMVLLFGIYIGGLVLLFTVVSAQQGRTAIILAILGFVGLLFFLALLLLVFAFIALRFLFIPQAVVLEGLGPLAAIRRSWRLIDGSFWRVLGVVVLLQILVQLVVSIPIFVVSLVLNIVLGDPFDPLQNYVLRQSIVLLTTYMAQILVLPLQLGTYTLLYYDMRVRKEGYDMQLLAQDYGLTG